MDIDFSMNGAEAVASKANNLAKSMGRLESAWSKYNRSVGKGSIGGGFLRGVGGSSGGSAGASLIGSAAAFITISKVMEKLMGDKVKEWASALVKEDLKRWGNIGKAIGKFFSPITRNLAANFKLLRSGAGQMLGGAWKGAKDMASQANIPLLLGFRNKMPKPIRALRFATKTFTSMISSALGKVPLSLMALPLMVALLDERASKWLNDKVGWVVEKIVNGVSKGIEIVGNLWGGFKKGLAKVTNNAYYTSSQVNRAEALRQLTPEQQKAYIASETKRLADEDSEEFIIRTRNELLKLFEEENEKRNKQIMGIQDIMVYQGRL